jgi:hypothetical protein
MAIFEGFSDDAFIWSNLVRAIQSGNSTDWFSQYPSESGKSLLDRLIKPQFSDLRTTAAFLDDWTVCEPFGSNSPNAKMWESCEATLDARPISGDRSASLVVTILDQLELPFFTLGSGDEILVIAELDNGLHSSSIQIFQTSNGPVAEVANLMLVADLNLNDAGPDFLLSRFVAVPSVLQAAAYLAETPFPSSTWMMQGTRESAFPSVPAAHRPQPFFDCVGNVHARVPWLDTEREVTIEFPEYEHGIRFGYKIPLNRPRGELLEIFDGVLSALPKINTMLDDGFLNAGPDSAAPFQTVLASGAAFFEGAGYSYRPYLELVREETARASGVGFAAASSAPSTPVKATRFCESCGAPRNAEARFCGSCGSRFG